MDNKMTVKFLSISENECFARNVIASFILNLNPTVSELNDIKTAVSEAVTNCIVHAYKNSIGKIYITVEIYPFSVIKTLSSILIPISSSLM